MSILGVDIGGTEVKFAVVDSNGVVGSFSSVKFDRNSKKLIDSLKTKTAGLKFSGIGIAVAGDVDAEKGTVRFSPNLKWKNVNLKKMFGDAFRMPVSVENDATAAAYGAYILDLKKKCRNAVCITLGTGVGGGIIINGNIYRGATGSAGEIGHLCYEPNGIKCSCGNSGCFERYIGRDGIISIARRKIKSRPTMIPGLAGGNNDKITPETITAAARQGDRVAKEIWDEAGAILGVLLTDIVDLLNPEYIVLTGGISKAGDFLLKPAVRELKKRAFEVPSQKVKVIISKHQNQLGVAGAALLSIKK